MKRLLDNHIFDERTRYENHRLIYTTENGDTIEFGGILAASIFAALLVDTPEAEARGIALDSKEQQAEFFACYEREVLRDDWGYLSAEINQLRDNYVQIVVGSATLNDICPNRRLLDAR